MAKLQKHQNKIFIFQSIVFRFRYLIIDIFIHIPFEIGLNKSSYSAFNDSNTFTVNMIVSKVSRKELFNNIYKMYWILTLLPTMTQIQGGGMGLIPSPPLNYVFL